MIIMNARQRECPLDRDRRQKSELFNNSDFQDSPGLTGGSCQLRLFFLA